MITKLLRDRVNWLWKNRHTHANDPDLPTQIQTIRETVTALGDAAAGSGATAHLSRRATQSISAAGTAVEWDTIDPVLGQYEFNVSVQLPKYTMPRFLSVLPLAESSSYPG